MLANKLRRAGGSAGGLFVDDLFSTYLYTGNSSTQTITNGIDLAGEGGMVWIKNRNNNESHTLTDTVRGATNTLNTNQTFQEYSYTNMLMSFLSDGFTVGNAGGTGSSGYTYTSWTFRKAPKFFDVVTYTGDGVAGRQIPHNLGTAVGTILVKRTDSTESWFVYHKELGASKRLSLNTTDPATTEASPPYQTWHQEPTDTGFYVGSTNRNNGLGATYVAYLFAHNDGDGGFGENGDEDIIKCGSYVADTAKEIDLGWEAQFVIVKRTTTTGGSWVIMDSLRGLTADGYTELTANTSAAEASYTGYRASPKGFYSGLTDNQTYIYIAIRRPHKPAESGSEVFDVSYGESVSPKGFITGFPVDMYLTTEPVSDPNKLVHDRLRSNGSATGSKSLNTTSTTAETANAYDTAGYFQNDLMDRVCNTLGTNWINYAFKRSPGFFDVVCYTGDGIAGRTVNHNLSAVPEMMIVKCRNTSRNWAIYADGNTSQALQFTSGGFTAGNFWNNTLPTESEISLGTDVDVNGVSNTYIAYLFASQAGISKVGNYTGNGTSQTIDCGFSTGARFILIKRTDSTGEWYIWDSVRGIVAGNDPHLSLNTTAAEVTTDDSVDPDASGFIVNQVAATNININSASYIFLAIA